MKKPQMKREVAILWAWEATVAFFSTIDALDDFKEFGKITSTETDNLYYLTIDSRYSFNEVVQYIDNY